MNEYYDAIIVGTGAAGLYCALNLPKRKKILMLTKPVSYTHLTLPTT